jgi:hypothetical protein
MRIVVDTNRVLLPHPEIRGEVTLAPYVIAEILLRKNPVPTIERLLEYDCRYGLEPHDAFDRVARFSEEEIVAFEPFIRPGDLATSTDFYVALVAPTVEHRKRALVLKECNQKFCGSMFRWATAVRNRMVNRVDRPRYDNLSGVLADIEFWPASVLDCITNGSTRQMKVTDAALLYSAVSRNQYLSRFFKTVLVYLISWSRLWREGRLNFDPSPDGNDYVDLTLPFYAADGDAIITADTKLRRAVSVVEPSGIVVARDSV